jgi:catechol 2,3-dioxygenase-like lactoylglutathione lyase family enzyme
MPVAGRPVPEAGALAKAACAVNRDGAEMPLLLSSGDRRGNAMDWKLDGRAVAFVNVGDAEGAVAFYGGALGMELLVRDDFGLFFAHGGALLRVTPMPEHVAGPHPVVGWEVADIRSAAEGLRASGVPLSIYEGFGQDARGIWTAPDGKVKVAWFADPWGNVLSLSETGFAA